MAPAASHQYQPHPALSGIPARPRRGSTNHDCPPRTNAHYCLQPGGKSTNTECFILIFRQQVTYHHRAITARAPSRATGMSDIDLRVNTESNTCTDAPAAVGAARAARRDGSVLGGDRICSQSDCSQQSMDTARGLALHTAYRASGRIARV